MLFAVSVEIFDPGRFLAGRIGEDARHRAPRPYLGTRCPRFAEIGHQRVGERADRTADMAPSVIDAGRPALELDRIHGHRRRYHTDVVGGEALEPDLAILESLHRWHRVVAAGR